MDLPEMDQEELDDIAARAKRYYETTDKALCGVFNGNVFELGQLYWGYEKLLLQYDGRRYPRYDGPLF